MSTPTKTYQLAYFVSHPIQYQAPLLKLLSSQSDIDLTVFFLTDVSIKGFKDPGFGSTISWDIPLLDGYKYVFLESNFTPNDFSFNNPKVKTKAIKKAILSKNWDAVWIHGYGNKAMLYIAYLCTRYHLPLMLRGDSNLICNPENQLKNLIKTFLTRILLSKCSALLYSGTANRNYYLNYGAATEKLFFVPLAVDNSAFQSSVSRPDNVEILKTKNKTLILFASKFIKRKNALLLVQAFHSLNEANRASSELWLIGNGEQGKEIQDYIDEHNLHRDIKILGFKNQSELPWYFSQCDVFVLPSEREPFGLVINEVMNLAKPIITTHDVGAAIDLVCNDKNGWVIEAGSKSALSAALNRALSKPHQLLGMGQESLKIISKWNFKADVNGIRAAIRSITS